MIVKAFGTVERSVEVDPAEYRGMPMLRIHAALVKLFRDIDPSVSYFEADLEWAAAQISDRFDVSDRCGGCEICANH